MKKIKLFSVKKKEKDPFGEYEFYFNFYLVLSKNYGFTFLIDMPNCSVSGRNPVECWKDGIKMLEEENCRYMRLKEVAGDDGTKQLTLAQKQIKLKEQVSIEEIQAAFELLFEESRLFENEKYMEGYVKEMLYKELTNQIVERMEIDCFDDWRFMKKIYRARLFVGRRK